MNTAGGEWRTTATLGEEPAIESEWYQPLWPGSSYFIAPYFRFGQRLTNDFDGQDLTNEFRVRETTGELSVGRVFDPWAELRIGMTLTAGTSKVRVGDPSIEDSDFNRGEAFVHLSFDMLDNVSFPTSGGAARAQLTLSREDFGADADFDQATLGALMATGFGASSLVLGAELGVTTEGRAPLPGLLRLGGFMKLSGFTQDELGGQNMGRLAATVFRRVVDSSLAPVYLGSGVEAGDVWEDRDDVFSDSTIWAGSAWLGTDTRLGPIFVGYGHAEQGVNAFYVVLGHSLI